MKLALLGDIAFFGSFDIKQNPLAKDGLKDIACYLKTFDYVVANLEVPFSKKHISHGAKSAFIFANPENIELLKYLRVNAVTLANNHMYDYGEEGYNLTKRLLVENAIEFYGVDGKTVKIDVDGNKLEFGGYCCYSSNPQGLVSEGEIGICEYDLNTTINWAENATKDGYFPIVSVHTGAEHVNYPDIVNIKAARKIADSCRYIYHGHHPHVLQGIEKYKDSLIAHSLGNFIFDDVLDESGCVKVKQSVNNRTSAVLEIVIENNAIISYKMRPIYIDKGGVVMRDYSEYNPSLYDFSECDSNLISYCHKRKALRDEYVASRKAMRTIKWYIDRISWRYVKLFIDMKKNKKRFAQKLISQI